MPQSWKSHALAQIIFDILLIFLAQLYLKYHQFLGNMNHITLPRKVCANNVVPNQTARAGADLGFLERGFVCIKVQQGVRFADVSHFS